MKTKKLTEVIKRMINNKLKKEKEIIKIKIYKKIRKITKLGIEIRESTIVIAIIKQFKMINEKDEINGNNKY